MNSTVFDTRLTRNTKAAHFQRAIRSEDFVAGAIFFCYNDYRTHVVIDVWAR